MSAVRSLLLFAVAALAEIGGAWLLWQGVREHRAGKDLWWFSVALACEELGVSTSGFYDWRARRDRPPTAAEREQARLLADLRRFHEASNGAYGAPRILADLRDEGVLAWAVAFNLRMQGCLSPNLYDRELIRQYVNADDTTTPTRHHDGTCDHFIHDMFAYLAEHTALQCGRLEHGFLRLRCDTCHAEHLVAFSCKRRGFCPSCGARRMVDGAA